MNEHSTKKQGFCSVIDALYRHLQHIISTKDQSEPTWNLSCKELKVRYIDTDTFARKEHDNVTRPKDTFLTDNSKPSRDKNGLGCVNVLSVATGCG